MESISCIWLTYLGMDGKIVASESTDTSWLLAGHWCVTGIWSDGRWSYPGIKHGMETLCAQLQTGPVTGQQCLLGRHVLLAAAGTAHPCVTGRRSRLCRVGKAVPHVWTQAHLSSRPSMPGRQSLAGRPCLPGQQAVPDQQAVLDQQPLPGRPPVTSAGGTDSVDFSDTWTIHTSPLLDDLDRSVVEPLRVGVDGDTGWSAEPRLPRSRACCDDPRRVGTAGGLVPWQGRGCWLGCWTTIPALSTRLQWRPLLSRWIMATTFWMLLDAVTASLMSFWDLAFSCASQFSGSHDSDNARCLSATFLATLIEPTLLAMLVVVPPSANVRALGKLRCPFSRRWMLVTWVHHPVNTGWTAIPKSELSRFLNKLGGENGQLPGTDCQEYSAYFWLLCQM